MAHSENDLNLFQQYLIQDKNATENTLSSYMRDLRQLESYFEGRGNTLTPLTMSMSSLLPIGFLIFTKVLPQEQGLFDRIVMSLVR